MARDIYHQTVRNALEKEGWTIKNDPFILKMGGLRMEIDLAAEKTIIAQKGTENIAVEIKSFLGKSKLNDFYEAKGQYDVYRLALQKDNSDKKLYLAIDSDIYESFFKKSLIAETLIEDKISLIVFDIVTQSIVQWINQ